MTITLLPITTPRAWEIKGIEEARARFPEASYERDGVRYWHSNNRPVPPSFFRENYIELTLAQVDADHAYTTAFLAAYRANPPVPSEEEMYEMRSSFGEGTVIVDVITGRGYQL